MEASRSLGIGYLPTMRKVILSRVLFMDGGHIVEDAPPAELFDNPKHPRLQEFLSKVLRQGVGLRKNSSRNLHATSKRCCWYRATMVSVDFTEGTRVAY